VQRLFGSPRALPLALALSFVLALPCVTVPLTADDWWQKLAATGAQLPGMSRRPLDLFTFSDGDPAHVRQLVDQGVFPWWADPRARLAFFRPLSALTHKLDWALWPQWPSLMYLHSLLWMELALLAAFLCYRRLLGPGWVAGLAIALHALDDAHGPVFGWIANRNPMVIAALGLPALALHDRWRRASWKPGAWLSGLSLFAALCAGEAAIAVAGYLLAYALILDEGTLAARLKTLWRPGVVLIAWRILYIRLGYGVSGSGIYLDPLGDSGAFFQVLPERAAALLVGQFALPWSDFTPLWPFLSPRLSSVMLAYSYAMTALLAWLFTPLLLRDRTARFFALGMLLALLPICATVPADRLLWFAGVGAMGLLARFLSQPQQGARRVGALLMIGLHLFLAPLFLALRARSMITIDMPMSRAYDSVPLTPEIATKTVVLFNPPSDPLAAYLLLRRAALGQTAPILLRWLAPGVDGVTVAREDPYTLRVHANGGFTTHITEQLLRSPRHPLALGEKVLLPGMRVEVIGQDDQGNANEARFQFDVPLEDPSLVWMRWDERRYRVQAPPARGDSLVLPRGDVFKAAEADP